ncbi:UDP-N-acetylmuramate dehydrogenase [Cytobacillus horneckiae]|uniref:UDP-N-acetylenolpyruvoylglucosamine reductase n=1 Tax=Cytobacillus horneckiae TaxID=549687 RepID=A0A2N0ZAA3_9BACI|nr:UDP-N-acetylmuramate dehydrogenase [Cytobacillus horneckiae]MEC1158036.1 UDP-N-acetylmuramate dehydrogenase [Cytobacillus horneckiae]MED2937039.1 UDP-N-acetylmuramate dehydrogenase [Cytobacillus horneckiae]NRG43580.1 UDP-N-acetylmuramate dehydrogenase [Bacillus sp. CRN 9]PKG26432.1 UDP-N-acetylenolpyruvoylglucosamine reductase [Cytobacillus horneckiae]
MNITETLKQLCTDSLIYSQEPMSKHTYIKVGGVAEYYIQAKNTDDVERIVQFAYTHHIPLTLIGKGANVIISDNGLQGIVLNLDFLNEIRIENKDIIAGSGATIIDVSRSALANGLSGLEFACGIPGSTGGAVFMNAGAYGGEVSDVLIEVSALTMKGERITLTPSDFQFAYRSSVFAKQRMIILEARFRLLDGKKLDIQEKMNEFTALRESKQPLEYPSCGSVFKRPPGHFAGKLIQDSGLQGLTIGGAQVSTKHAGFMVNVNEATATDYIELIRKVQGIVNEKFKVNLEREVQIIGEDDTTERG